MPKEQVRGHTEQGNNSQPVVAATATNPGFKGNHLPKIRLITFDGNEPRAWIRKCDKYFEVIMFLGNKW